MRFQKWTISTLVLTLAFAFVLPMFSRADDLTDQPVAKPSIPAGKTAKKEPVKIDLKSEQDKVALRYKKFEDALYALAQFLADNNEENKATLIRRAINRTQEEQISRRMSRIIALLNTKEFGDAVENQDEVIVKLKTILELLQTEDRLESIAAEKKRIKDLLKDLNKLINKEKIIRFQVERGQIDPALLAKVQADIAKKTKELRDKIDKQDAAKNGKPKDGKPKDGKPKDGKPKDGKPKDGKPTDGKPKDGKPKDGKPSDEKPKDGKPKDGKPKDEKPKDGKPKDGKPSDGKPKDGKPKDGKPSDGKPKDGKPKDGKPKDGKPKDGKPSDGKPMPPQPMPPAPKTDPPKDEKTPGRDEIEEARKAMERAIEELKKKNFEGASKEQDKAIEELILAQQKLEEILKQLREEERELMLRDLQSRFKNMLRMQKIVLNGTVSLNTSPVTRWKANDVARSRTLSNDEGKIAIEANKALMLLKEEGSSIAFPEAVEELREDMLTVARMLAKKDAGRDNQEIQRDILDALGEIIDALKKELEKKKKDDKPKPPKPPKDGDPPDPSLVDKLAELKMLRSLQMRVNRRTRRLGNKITGEQATEKTIETAKQLQQLAKRQARIHKAAYDLATNKNQ